MTGQPKWLVAGGRWQVAGGRWQVAGGRWQVAGGRWQVAGGRWQVFRNLESPEGATAFSHGVHPVVPRFGR
ncbi:hypothetical protein HAHE_15650 [Haloferula helveola]|uniref:Uncharacterized protein n=1 Tax=Haloferula helveola TaxID=490095 RepID=A0ABM7RJ67_9BACT|nr:hypothetical protein HAHE_15650 [Haloferula helveola]